MASVLSSATDGYGFYYGFVRGYRIDIRCEPVDPEDFANQWLWRVYIDGEHHRGGFHSKGEAEMFASARIMDMPAKD
jgi:hypothetical protein